MRFVIRACLIVLVVTVVLVPPALIVSVVNLYRELNQDRDRARVTTCINYNEEQLNDRESLAATFRALVVGELDDQQQATYDRIVVAAEAANPFRDCSPAGIDDYFENPPPDPAR